MTLGFNTKGNSQTSGRTSVAMGLGCLRNTKGSLTRKFNYCYATDRNVAFQCVFNQPVSYPPICPSIALADIATYGIYGIGNYGWLLNGNTSILACQTLDIPQGEILLPNHYTLTNNGTINLRGVLRNTTEASGSTGDSITVNNGTINIFSNGTIAVSVEFGDTAIFTNNGVVNNSGDIFCQTSGVINNNSGGVINNYSTEPKGFRLNAEGVFNNYGALVNNIGASITVKGSNDVLDDGTINNYSGATIANYGTITIGDIDNTGGIINNSSISFINNGTINILEAATFYNTDGTINNNTDSIMNVNYGTINLDTSSIVNNGTLFVSNNGEINGTLSANITNYGTISKADGIGTCGIGYINVTINPAGTQNAACPT